MALSGLLSEKYLQALTLRALSTSIVHAFPFHAQKLLQVVSIIEFVPCQAWHWLPSSLSRKQAVEV
jgi:hypothetical protein